MLLEAWWVEGLMQKLVFEQVSSQPEFSHAVVSQEVALREAVL